MAQKNESLFNKLHLKPAVISQLVKNPSLSANLAECMKETGISEYDSSIGKLIYAVATRMKMTTRNAISNRPRLMKYIANGKIDNVRLETAMEYCLTADTFNETDFEKRCSVGHVTSAEEMERGIDEIISNGQSEIALSGKKALKGLLNKVKAKFPFADGKTRSKIFMEKFNAALESVPEMKTSAVAPPVEDAKKDDNDDAEDDEEETVCMEKWLTGRDLADAHNHPEALKTRESRLNEMKLPEKERFLTRFPPEPNGFLHIGHCKAMTFNFTLADKKGGHCYLRFDDTNPSAEEQVYIDNIIENVQWMGFKPWKITYSSDYFEEMFELAIKMIKDGNAYVCHQSKAEMEEGRRSLRLADPSQHTQSPWRDSSVEENLRKFKLMRMGFYDEGEACLRMKGDLSSPNPNMWDHVAYRIKYEPHPHVGDAWCIYPTYDYTHCTIDSLEWISASCCTLEFENRRESYFWLLDVLELYKPVVWEYSRLNITYNVLSKRKLIQLVKGGYVRGWNDPRILTINGLRRRGYTNTILRSFCDLVGVTRKTNFISPLLLESCARKELEETASRAMAVLNPLKVILTNWKKISSDKFEEIVCPDFPGDKDREGETHSVKFGRIVWIDANDFRSDERAVKDKRFFGMAVGKTVRLKYAYNVTCNRVNLDDSGNVASLECTLDPESRHDLKGVRKGHLSWVCKGIPCEFRLYDNLFRTEIVKGDDWLDQLNGDSEMIYHGLVDEYAIGHKDTSMQFERIGYFIRDCEDYTPEMPVFNRIIPLKQSKVKRTLSKK